MGTNSRRPPKSNASLNYSDGDDAPLMNPGDPEVARAECCRWYYQIVPPSSLPLADGADYDWPGPEYETVAPETDARHYKKRINGKTHK